MGCHGYNTAVHFDGSARPTIYKTMEDFSAPLEPKYNGLPRRYEETKPALTQVYSHNRILSIGESVRDKFYTDVEHKKQIALQEHEEKLWKEAEDHKNKCVEEALNQAQTEWEQEKQELESNHNKFVQSAISRTKEIMKQKCVEKLFDERVAGEKALEKLSLELKRKYQLEKMAEIKAVRIEEQAIAEKFADDMREQFRQEKEQYGESLDTIRRQDLERQHEQLEEFRLQSIRETQNDEQRKAEKRMEEVMAQHREEASQLLKSIEDIRSDMSKLEDELNATIDQRNYFISKYNNLRKEFTDFIEQSRPDFSKGQADFLLAPNEI